MTLLQIPVRNDLVAYRMRLALDGVYYRWLFKWNPSAGKWFLTLSDDASQVLIGSRGIVLHPDLLRPFRYRAIPQGELIVYDTQKKHIEPNLDNFGKQVLLLYREP